MFAYCGNNPNNRSDFAGRFWQELADEFIRQVQDKSTYFALSAAVSQGDSIALGPADVISLGLLAIGVAVCAGTAVYTALQETTVVSANSSIGQRSIEEELNEIANSYELFQCKEAAQDIAKHLKRSGKKAEIITITYVGGLGYIWSDMRKTTISSNGIHVGVLYNGMVYCNVHPFGLPEANWISDFHGTGGKYVTKIPI